MTKPFNMNCMLPAHQKQQLLGLLGEEAGEVSLLVADRPEQLVLVATVERRLPDQHLVEEDAKGPPVHAVRVLHPLDDLSEGGMCEVSISTYLVKSCPPSHISDQQRDSLLAIAKCFMA